MMWGCIGDSLVLLSRRLFCAQRARECWGALFSNNTENRVPSLTIRDSLGFSALGLVLWVWGFGFGLWAWGLGFRGLGVYDFGALSAYLTCFLIEYLCWLWVSGLGFGDVTPIKLSNLDALRPQNHTTPTAQERRSPKPFNLETQTLNL